MTTKSDDERVFSSRPRLALILLIWTAVCVLMAVRTYLRFLPFSESPPWMDLITFNFGYWYMWALATPLIFYLGRRFPLERGRLGKSLPAHFFFGCLFAGVFIAYYTVLMLWRWSGTKEGMDPALLSSGMTPDASSFSSHFRIYVPMYLHFDLLTYWSVLGIGHAFTYYDRFQERALRASQLEARAANLKASLVEAQLQAVRMQIQPHFLFNTLHAVSSLMDDDVPSARRMMARLSDLLRLTLDHGERQEVSFQEELQLVNHYLEIEEVRFHDRLTVSRHVSSEALFAKVPSFFLQPIVENALRHGIGRNPDAGKIELHASVREGVLRVEVKDDGPGCPHADLETLTEGIGLSSVRRRLEGLGNGSGRLELANRNPRGFSVVVTIPFQVGHDLRGETE